MTFFRHTLCFSVATLAGLFCTAKQVSIHVSQRGEVVVVVSHVECSTASAWAVSPWSVAVARLVQHLHLTGSYWAARGARTKGRRRSLSHGSRGGNDRGGVYMIPEGGFGAKSPDRAVQPRVGESSRGDARLSLKGCVYVGVSLRKFCKIKLPLVASPDICATPKHFSTGIVNWLNKSYLILYAPCFDLIS